MDEEIRKEFYRKAGAPMAKKNPGERILELIEAMESAIQLLNAGRASAAKAVLLKFARPGALEGEDRRQALTERLAPRRCECGSTEPITHGGLCLQCKGRA